MTTPDSRPRCYRCKYRRNLPGDAHIACVNRHAQVTVDPHGFRFGWAFWPPNFDPVWITCHQGFEPAEPKEPTCP